MKAPLYAEGGSPEYWIVNVPKGLLEVFRDPRDGQWQQHLTLTSADVIRPVSFPDVEIRLRDFLIPRH